MALEKNRKRNYLMCIEKYHFTLQLFVGAMGPPGGGRNDITGRFTRHLQVISIDEFDDNTMTRIFTNISDWHFGKGFEPAFLRLGKVRPRILLRIQLNLLFINCI